MKNELLTKGIILPSGEIGKDKINLVAGAITQPFAEMVWVRTQTPTFWNTSSFLSWQTLEKSCKN